MDNIKNKILSKENISKILDGKIPNIFEEYYEKYIEDFNKVNKVSEFWIFFSKNEILMEYNTEFYENVLLEIKETLMEIYNNFITIKDDFEYFINKFNKDFDSLNLLIKIEKDKSINKKNQRIEGAFIDDISFGILSYDEACSKKWMNYILDNKYTNEFYNLDRKLKYGIDNFYSYLYIKTEQILSFFYQLFNNEESKKTKIFLIPKYDFFIKNNLFNINDLSFSKEIIEDLNNIWIHYKHQTILEQKVSKKLYKKETISLYISYIKNIYDSLSSISNFKILIDMIREYHEKIDETLNPLGITEW